MIRAVVVGLSYSQFATYIRNRGLNPNNYLYYGGGNTDKLRGLDSNTRVLCLEGWSDNDSLTVEDMKFVKNRFQDIQYVSEEWIYNEGFKF